MVYQYESLNIEIDMDIIVIQEFYMQERINQHTQTEITGIIHGKPEGETIVIRKKDGKILFAGKIISIEIETESELCKFRLKASSYSFDLEGTKRRRVFQNLDMTYEEVISTVLKSYKKSSFIDKVTNGKKIPHMIIQFEESDWDFLKRLASHFDEGICVNSQSESVRLFFGQPKDDIRNITGETISRRTDILQDYEVLKVKSYDRYEPGHMAEYKSNRYVIRGLDLSMEKGELFYHVYLERGQAPAVSYQPDIHLAGARVWANVKEIEDNRMKLQFQMEEMNSGSNTPFFTYSGEVNNEMGYYMPEPGNEVEVYFPAAEEESAVVTSARRTPTGVPSGEKSSMKYMRNKEGRELYMDESEVHFSAGEGNTAIRLAADGTLTISGSQTVHIEAGTDLELGGRTGQVMMQAENGISIAAGAGGMSRIIFDESGNVSCKSFQNVLYKKNEGITVPESEGQEHDHDNQTNECSGAQGLRDVTLALAGVEFLSQAVTGTSDFQSARKVMNRFLGKGSNGCNKTEKSGGNKIKEELFQNNDRLFHSFAYGENKNGG